MAAALVLASAAGGSCLDDGTMLCVTGLRCPPSMACTTDGTGCTATPCGNGIVEETEACDDGNVASGDGCRDDCLSTEECGNGIVDEDEECDRGPQNSDTGGECSRSCTWHCGDGRLNQEELCDQSLFRVSCLDLGFDRGTLGCQSCRPDDAPCSTIGWERPEHPGAGALHGVWGLAPDAIFAVGTDERADGIAILRFDGQAWTRVVVSSPGTFLGIWASSLDDVFAVGDGGKVLNYNGTTWHQLNAGVAVTLRDVWGIDHAGDVLAAGDEATIVRYSRSSKVWLSESLPGSVPDDTSIEALWGSGPLDVYAVGSGGTIVHYIDKGWVREAVGLTDADLFDVWGTDDGDVFAVGERGTILRRAADGWTIMDNDDTTDLHGVWSSDPDLVFAVGERGTVLSYDGHRWMPLATATDLDLAAVWGTPGAGVMAVGQNGILLRYGGWSYLPPAAPTDSGAVRALWARGLEDVYALVAEAPYLQHFDGQAWADLRDRSPELHELVVPHADGTSPLRDLWGNASGELYAVGDDSTILHHVPGQGWQRVDLDAAVSRGHLHRVWGTEDGHVFVVGEASDVGGLILRHDGTAWEQMTANTVEPLRGVWGPTMDDVFAVGDSGTILHYDGNQAGEWERTLVGTGKALHAIWGSTRENVFVVGESGTALLFNGYYWRALEPITEHDLIDVWGMSAEHVFAAGSGGSLFHYRGPSQWEPVRTRTDQNLSSVWGVGSTHGSQQIVLFGGDSGIFDRLLVSEGGAGAY